MEVPFPYGDPLLPPHVYMPQTHHSGLLENDAAHYLAACFLHGATNRDPIIIQHKLAEVYGGHPSQYPLLVISPKAYLLSLPEYLDRNRVEQNLFQWAISNHIHIWCWTHESGWNSKPIGFKINLEVRNYPLNLWHHQFFHLLVSDFGLPLYIDDANSFGNDRSTLRISISCVDPARLPPFVLLIYKDSWRICPVTVIGWEYNGNTALHDHGSPSSDGRLLTVQWPREPMKDFMMRIG